MVSLFFEGQVVGNCMVAKVGGKKLRTIFLWVPRINSCSVGGSGSKLSEVGLRTCVSGFVILMYTALIIDCHFGEKQDLLAY